MKEVNNPYELKTDSDLLSEPTDELINLSEIIRNDGLRYERTLDAEEETDEL